MDEAQIKAAVLNHLRSVAPRGKKPTVTSEFTLGNASVRADLAILADEFIGVEIKSATDTLKRVPSQMAGYALHFDQVVLVVAERHLKRLVAEDLCGASLWTVTKDGGIVPVHHGRANKIAAPAYMNLLTQAEIERLVYRPNAQRPSSAGLSDAVIRSAFTKAFEQRYNPTSETFWRAVARRKIRAQDLTLLSRFSEERVRRRAVAQQQADFWQSWTDNFRSNFMLTA
ncbi:sce7726 family protein [Sphingobium sp. 3R8]|uniref:sce7726 family protein n=1 Tax=Sphingobium sp. 3R8 TaxID=2874921 RepID=UPI001CCA8991|nr:sce7726 family protein [Sphingobium sp. 3R8]MBZ9649392.1 sce7726 family protein [Sphingobium sp. 3R8]